MKSKKGGEGIIIVKLTSNNGKISNMNWFFCRQLFGPSLSTMYGAIKNSKLREHLWDKKELSLPCLSSVTFLLLFHKTSYGRVDSTWNSISPRYNYWSKWSSLLPRNRYCHLKLMKTINISEIRNSKFADVLTFTQCLAFKRILTKTSLCQIY